jgi:hypothetical protein
MPFGFPSFPQPDQRYGHTNARKSAAAHTALRRPSHIQVSKKTSAGFVNSSAPAEAVPLDEAKAWVESWRYSERIAAAQASEDDVILLSSGAVSDVERVPAQR